MVEILRSAAKLSNGEYVAAHTGKFTLTDPYDRDTKTIKIASLLAPEYKSSPQLFLRVWEEEKSLTPGTAVPLVKTGIEVTISTDADGKKPFHVGDYWQIAIRPGSSPVIDLKRYIEAPQPPDGPRLWVCPLAVLEWESDGKTYKQPFQDCREKFDNLVELTKRPKDSTTTIIKVQELDRVAFGIALGFVSALYTFLACLICKNKFCQPFICFGNDPQGNLFLSQTANNTPAFLASFISICFSRAIVALIIGWLMGWLIAFIYNWWVKK